MDERGASISVDDDEIGSKIQFIRGCFFLSFSYQIVPYIFEILAFSLMYCKFRIWNFFSFKHEIMADILNMNVYEFIIKILNMR